MERMASLFNILRPPFSLVRGLLAGTVQGAPHGLDAPLDLRTVLGGGQQIEVEKAEEDEDDIFDEPDIDFDQDK